MLSKDYDRMEDRARVRPNSTEAIAVIEMNEKRRKRSEERRRAILNKFRAILHRQPR